MLLPAEQIEPPKPCHCCLLDSPAALRSSKRLSLCIQQPIAATALDSHGLSIAVRCRQHVARDQRLKSRAIAITG
jgi:hypothetical protein